MRTALARLGELVRTLRLTRKITQEQLASCLEPKTNRSAVAHLEQGLRLPNKEVLKSICAYLEIPDDAWKYFESVSIETANSARRNKDDYPRIICVSGIQGSGKTTLAHSFAVATGSISLSEDVPGKRYLNDLKANPKRWAFETQLAFLCFKALEILRKAQSGHRIVIDRSLDEDVKVFAQIFKDKNEIDDRAFQTYTALADYFGGVIPKPDLIVLCKCSPETAYRRIQSRMRADKDLHTLEHLTELARKYSSLFDGETEQLVFEVDSETQDFRNREIVEKIIKEALDFWRRRTVPEQLTLSELFDPSEVAGGLPIFSNSPEYPIAYIAAPFTGMASSITDTPTEQLELFGNVPLHGRIGKGKYRDVLTGITKSLNRLGVNSILPHRDVNQWGDVTVPPEKVMSLCTDHVILCDMFIGILGNSSGSHYEFGVAMGMEKPSIIIHCAEISDSYLARGVVSLRPHVLDVSCETMREIPLVFSRTEVKEFIFRQLSIAHDPEG